MDKEYTKGLTLGASAYLIWGLAPIYFKSISEAGSFEILAHRIVWSVVFLALIMTYKGHLRELGSLLFSRATLGPLLLSTLMISSNWLVFIYAINSGQTLEASFGYFLNPLIIILMGVFFFKERLSGAQWLSLAFAGAAILYQLFEMGHVPWISLFLASTFGVYGLVRKKLMIGSVQGLFVETLLVLPPALGFLAYLSYHNQIWLSQHGANTDMQLMLAGVITSIPLMLFASGARRLPYSIIGFLQYIAPSLQLIVAIFLFGESLPPSKLVSFVLVWTGLFILITHRHIPLTWAKIGQKARS